MPKGFLGTGFAIGLSTGFFATSRAWEVAGTFLVSVRGGGVGVGLLSAVRGEELGVSCFGEVRGDEANAVSFDTNWGEALDVDFSTLGRGDPVFATGLRKRVVGTGFFFSVRGGDVVTDFNTVRVGIADFPFASTRGGVMGVGFFTEVFEGVLEMVGFFDSARGDEAGVILVEVTLGGEAGGGVVFTVSGCFPRRAVAVVAGLAVEAPARVFLTVNGIA